MQTIFFLSIRNENVQMILDGWKKWEFRQNQRFGILPDVELTPGAILFIVSTFHDSASTPRIECICRVTKILRGSDFHQYFADRSSGHWTEAGCEEGTGRDWDFFDSNILGTYITAIGLSPYPLSPAIDCNTVRHKMKQTPWRGTGLTPIKSLHRYVVGEKAAAQYFTEIANKTLKVE